MQLRSAGSRAPAAHIQTGLTSLSTCGGCTAKLSPQYLAGNGVPVYAEIGEIVSSPQGRISIEP